MLSSAFRPEPEIFGYLNPLSIFSIIPKALTFDNFNRLVAGSEFARAVLNSLVVAAVTSVLGLAVCSPAAFALAILRFPGRNALFVILFITFSVPFELIAIPLAASIRDWGLANTYFALIMPSLGNGIVILLLRQFFLAVPRGRIYHQPCRHSI